MEERRKARKRQRGVAMEERKRQRGAVMEERRKERSREEYQ
jgi:hypothetical protein